MSEKPIPPFVKSEGVTATERLLHKLCTRTFLSLWSYPNVFRDQGEVLRGGDGKEICDLLVVSGDHVIIFSDKDCAFTDSGSLAVDWSRWYRRAIADAAKQLFGAEKWIRRNPNRIFLDKFCSIPFPVSLPPAERIVVHRIIVAHGASERCKKHFGGGSGSLVLDSSLTGKDHLYNEGAEGHPFCVGQVDPKKGFVHVFDDASLAIIMDKLDTISDFLGYLTRKEELCTQVKVFAPGEEEMLAQYLANIDSSGHHDFAVADDADGAAFAEGSWIAFANSPQRQRQVEADRVSYVWDHLIETFSRHTIAGTQHFCTSPSFSSSETILRFMAAEVRTRRRILGDALQEAIENTPHDRRFTRIVYPSTPGDPYYIFLLVPHLKSVPYEEYREVRRQFLEVCCMAVKAALPEALDIIGIATESGKSAVRTEDAVYLDARVWTEENQREAQSLRNDLDLLQNVTTYVDKISDYPSSWKSAVTPFAQKAVKAHEYNGNWPCPCGSKRKFKKCCKSKLDLVPSQ